MVDFQPLNFSSRARESLLMLTVDRAVLVAAMNVSLIIINEHGFYVSFVIAREHGLYASFVFADEHSFNASLIIAN